MALTASDYRVYWLASDCQTCIMGVTDAGVLETLAGFKVEAVDDLSIGDAQLNWSTADANAEVLVVDLPAGDSEEVPLMVLGQAIGAVDLGFFDGYTETNLAVVDLDKDSWVMLGFSADDIPSLSCGGVATYIEFLDMVHIGAFNSTTQGSGIPLSTTESGNFRVYSDDAGAAIVHAGAVGDTRGLLSRFLVTVDHSANDVRFSGAMGHIKSYDGIWGNEQVSGVYGYLEIARDSETVTLTDYGISAGSIACVENDGVVTIDTNHVLAGFAAISKITGDLTATGKTAGLLVTTYDTTNWSDSTARIDWEYGLYIDSATVAGIEIADAPTTGLLISGACATGIKVTGLGSTAALQLGVSGTTAGDFLWYGTTAAYVITFDADGDTNGAMYVGADSKGLMFNLYGDITGCGVFWDPSGDTNGQLTFGATGGSKGIDVVFYGDTSGAYVTWDRSEDDLIFSGAAQLLVASGLLTVGADAVAGTFTLFPTTTVSGITTYTMTDNVGDTTTNINIAAQAGARTYTMPDAGGSANIVLLTSAQAVAGTLTRADLTEEALAVYGLPATAVKQVTGIPLSASESAGTFNLDITSDVWLIQGEIANNETETSEGAFQFVLPPEYVSGGDVTVRIKNRMVLGAGTDNGSTLDVEVFEQDGNGAVGADLCTTTAVTYAGASAWQTTDFVVTGSGLVAGDILNIVITTNVVESASSDIHAELDGLALLLDIKG